MERLKLIKEHEAEFADVLSVKLIVIEAAAEAARGEKHLASIAVVAMRLFAGEGVAGNFLEESFAQTDAGDGEIANVQTAAQGDEDQSGDSHDVGAIAAHAKGFHAGTHIAPENIWEPLAEKRNFQGGEAMLARAGSDVG